MKLVITKEKLDDAITNLKGFIWFKFFTYEEDGNRFNDCTILVNNAQSKAEILIENGKFVEAAELVEDAWKYLDKRRREKDGK